MKRLRLYVAALLATVSTFGGMLALSAPASALFEGTKDQACNGAALQSSGGCSNVDSQASRVSDTLKIVLNILSFVVGVVAVIMLIIGGIRFVTSQGEGSSTALARNTIIYALVGIVVAVMAQFLVQFVIGRATKGDAPGQATQTSQVTNPDGSVTTTTTTTNSNGTTTTRVCTNGVCRQ